VTQIDTSQAPSADAPQRDGMLTLIGAFKLLKGTLLLLIAVGAHHLLHKNVEGVAVHWIQHFRADPNSKYLHKLLAKLLGVTDKKLELLSVGTFIYGSLFLVEGIGLVMQKTWAEYLTIFTTGGLIPLEIYEIFHHVRVIKIVVFLINLAIVAYLVIRLKRQRR